MKLALAFLALVTLSQGVPLTWHLGPRIINGQDAEVGEIPYQVSLWAQYTDHFCGGSIINKNYVITAAHCVESREAESIKILAGTNDFEHLLPFHEVIEIIVHAELDLSPYSTKNDIALLRVKLPFEFSKTISYVSLPEQDSIIPTGANAVVSGWGKVSRIHSSFVDMSSTKLQRTDVQIVDQEHCKEVNAEKGYPVYDSEICANDPNVDTGVCNGDSGGPLTVDGVLVGIVSWGVECGSSKFPTVFTRVPNYIDWINAHAV